MKLREYKFQVRHDKGDVSITIPASNVAAAITMLMEVEGCPERAIQTATVPGNDMQGYFLLKRKGWQTLWTGEGRICLRQHQHETATA